jgi:hypothetical protein
VVNDTGSDDVHPLDVTEGRLQVVEIYQDLTQKLSVFNTFEGRMVRTCARNILLDLFEGLDF